MLSIRHSADHNEKGKSLVVSTCSPARRGDGNQRNTKEMLNWKPHVHEWVKINVDAAFSAQSGEASIGLIIRDHAGQVLLTACKVIQRCSSVEEAEATTCFEGVQLAVEWISKPAIL